jgi:hypothetical protein
MRRTVVAQLAAALVSVAMSGAPRVAAAHAPDPVHRCTCPASAGAHACECAMCRHQALATLSSDDRLPRCHREMARKALSRERDRSHGAPCLEGTCGASDEAAPPPPAVDPFCPPASRALPRAVRAAPLASSRAAGTVRTLEPEVPPPRAA